MQNGWSANHTHFRTSADYSNSYSSGSTSWGSGVWVEGHIGSIKADYYEIVWGDGTANTTLDHKPLSKFCASVRAFHYFVDNTEMSSHVSYPIFE